jgi:hypothetical protein
MFFAVRLRNFGQITREYLVPALRMSYLLHRVRRTADRSNEVLNSMMKTFTTLTAAATLAVALAAVPTDANAQWRRGWGGPAIGLGILGGVAAGAIVGSAIANSYGPAYVVQPGYVPYGAYAGGPPVGCPGGYWARMPVYDPYGNVVGYRGRPRYFCP